MKPHIALFVRSIKKYNLKNKDTKKKVALRISLFKILILLNIYVLMYSLRRCSFASLRETSLMNLTRKMKSNIRTVRHLRI